MDGAWRGLDEDVARLVARLRPLGSEIGANARAGDALAQRVIDYYTMLHRRVDPVAYQLTKDALEEWQRTNQLPQKDYS